MIDFNMLDRFDGPTRIGVFRTLTKCQYKTFLDAILSPQVASLQALNYMPIVQLRKSCPGRLNELDKFS